MNQYIQPDQYYIDNFDRVTIKELKELEKFLPEGFNIDSPYNSSQIFTLMGSENKEVSNFFFRGFSRANIRKDVIEAGKSGDLLKDKLIKNYPAPTHVYCNKCNDLMKFDTYLFKDTFEEQILFAFSCSKHSPRKVVYPNGREYCFKEKKCKHCTGRISSKTETKGSLLVFTDTCQSCGEVEIIELDNAEEDELPITEEERIKYCLQFLSVSHFFEDLEAIAKVAEHFEEKDAEKRIKKQYEVDKIKMINVPALDTIIKKETEQHSYTKFEFIKTDLTKFAMLTFTVLDPANRDKKESLKQISTILDKTLFETNWRLVSTSLDYRLGIVTGRIRAYETEDDLLKLAKSIQLKKSK